MDSKPASPPLTIGRLARLGGVNLEAVRYYEREGLLMRPPRTRSGYRIFSRDAARRLRFIKRAQQLGFSLAEIRELLAMRVKPGLTLGDGSSSLRDSPVRVSDALRLADRLSCAVRRPILPTSEAL